MAEILFDSKDSKVLVDDNGHFAIGNIDTIIES